MNLKNTLIIFGLGVMIAIAGFLNISKETKETKAETVEVEIETETKNMVDLSQLVSFEETETGIILYLADGTEHHVENVPNITEWVYPICDVIYSYGDTVDSIWKTNLVCAMPNGKLHVYKIKDAPEGKVELVCFRTANQDDYNTYEVVAVR